MRVYPVSELVRAAHRVLERQFEGVWVEGEVSNLKLAASGHAYFTLKDAEAALPTTMWRSSVQRLRFALEEGLHVRVLGRLGVYDRQGKLQLYAERIEPAGLGALMLQLEQLKRLLRAEGLFDAARKRAIPSWPRIVAVVTSEHGAAIHDILKVARRRCPSRIVLSPAIVQGEAAPGSIVRALQRVQRIEGVDVVIVGRGGGAIEDLWAFNDERVARAIVACSIPVVSAVGHEVDVTIADLVADLRAATPSHAAELVVPDRRAWVDRVAAMRAALVRGFERRVLDERGRLDAASFALHRAARQLLRAPRAELQALGVRLREQHPQVRVARDRRRLDHAHAELRQRSFALTRGHRLQLAGWIERLREQHPRVRLHAERRRLELQRARLGQLAESLTRQFRVRVARAVGALEALSPLAVLARGYAVVSDATGQAIVDGQHVTVGDPLRIRLHRGSLRAVVAEVNADSVVSDVERRQRS